MWLRRFRMTIMCGALALGLGCATKNIAQGPSGRFELQQVNNSISPEQEIELGRQAAQEVERQLPLLPESSPITRYVQQLGHTLADHAPGEIRWPFSFHVVNQKEINAFALPGGPIFINLGTIQAADDEGQLAGVMAHEISHVVLRHGTQQATKQQMAQIPLAVLGGVLPQGVGGQLARLGLSLGAQSIFLKYSREAEREADLLGAQIMYDAGYDPYGLVEFFTKLEREGGPGVPQFLSDHPDPGNRVEVVKAAIQKFPPKRFRRNSPEFERIKALSAQEHPLTAEQIAARQQAQGQNINPLSVVPSNEFLPLNHDAFAIDYPNNWKAYGDATSPVTIAPEACLSRTAVACGVIISGFRGSQPNQDLQQVTSELVQSMQRASPQLQFENRAQPMQVGGAPGASVKMISPSPFTEGGQPLTERDTLVTVDRGDGTFVYMIFIAPQTAYQSFSPAFERMLGSFRLR